MKIKERYKKLPKPVRFGIKASGAVLAFITAPIWLPLACLLWVVVKTLLEIMESYERS